MQTDIYIQIINILELDVPNKVKADLIKKLIDNMNDELIKLVIDTCKK